MSLSIAQQKANGFASCDFGLESPEMYEIGNGYGL
jgi:hypothetical protein